MTGPLRTEKQFKQTNHKKIPWKTRHVNLASESWKSQLRRIYQCCEVMPFQSLIEHHPTTHCMVGSNPRARIAMPARRFLSARATRWTTRNCAAIQSWTSMADSTLPQRTWRRCLVPSTPTTRPLRRQNRPNTGARRIRPRNRGCPLMRRAASSGDSSMPLGDPESWARRVWA